MVQNEILWWQNTRNLAVAALSVLLGVIAAAWALLIYFPGVGSPYPVAILIGLVGIPFLASAIFARYCRRQDDLDINFDMAEDA